MVDYEIFKKIAEEISESKENPFASFGLKGNIRIISPPELTSLMVRYKNPNYSEQLLGQIAKLMSSNTKENNTLAIVGPQGVGKTTLALDLENSIKEQRSRGHFDYINKIKMIEVIPFRMAIDEKFNFLGEISKFNKEDNIFIFEDCQELFLDTETKKASEDLFELLIKKLNVFSHSVFIFTFNTYGWKIASSKIPDLLNYFNNILWLNGLSNPELKDAIEKRLCYFSINELKKINIGELFEDENYLNKIIRYSSKNPRLMIQLVASCIEESFKRKLPKINKVVIDKVLKDEGIDKFEVIKKVDLLKNKVLYSMLSYPRVPIRIISKLGGLDRTTILRELEKQIDLGRVSKTKNPSNKREYLYSIKSILKAVLEQILMDKTEEKTKSILLWSSHEMKV